MLRKKIIRKIYFTTLIVFVLFVISSFTMNKNISNIKVEYQTNLTGIYLMDENNYLLEVKIVVSDNLEESIPIVINSLKSNYNHYSGLKGIIPDNTTIQNIKIEDDLLTIDFNEALFNINQDLEEKLVESLVFSLLNFKEINRVKITINNKPLKVLPKSKIKIDDILTKNIGINKEYQVSRMQDIQKVVLYFYEEKDGNRYYVPVTKYLNSSDDKIKIIIDNLKNDYLMETNLMSYLEEKVKIENYEYKNNIVYLSFLCVKDLMPDLISEEVIYVLSSSIFDSTEATKVIFMSNDNILAIKDK